MARREATPHDRLLVSRALALALNPTLDTEEIAHRLLESSEGSRPALARALGLLALRSLDGSSRAANRAARALRRALELQCAVPGSEPVLVGLPRPGDEDFPLGPAA